MGRSARSSTAALEAGWEELAGARWDAARRSFEDALSGEEAAEALEGLSWAAWWQDDAEAVFQTRERAFGLYREQGEPASAARMATWLAIDHLDFHGSSSVAGGWLRRARRLLEPLEAGPDHGWLTFLEGYIAHAQGEAARALSLGAQTLELGRRFGVPDLEMLGLALQGAVLVASAEVGEGMGLLDEATTAALQDDAQNPISGAWACCFLVSGCEAVRDYGRAFEWCDRIAEFADRYGSRYMLGFCRAHYGAIDMWRGRWSDAEAALQAAAEDYGESRPAFAPGALARLAELRRRQGRTEEARRLLDEAAGHGSVLLCRARLALDDGEALRAAELGERFLRQIPEHSRLDRVPGLELLARARTARGELDEAAVALEELRGLCELVGTEALLAGAEAAGGALAAAGGDHERARRLLEDAIDGYERSGAPFEAAVARVELAASLFALGRDEQAREEAKAAEESLLELGAAPEASRARQLLDAAASRDRGPAGLQELTAREREVLSLLAEGLTNRAIAERLVVSEHTVHRHVTNILRKLDLPTRTAAAAHAARSGLLESREPGA